MRLDPASSAVTRAIAMLVLLALAWLLREPAMVVFGAVLFAATLRAMADPLAAHTPLSLRAAVGVVLVVLVALLAGGLWLLGDPLSEQLHDLRAQLPKAWQALQGWLQGLPFGKRVLSLGADLLREGAVQYRRGDVIVPPHAVPDRRDPRRRSRRHDGRPPRRR